MARSKHLKIYIDTYRLCRELFRIREKLPKTLKYNLGEMAFASSVKMIRGIVVANGSKEKLKALHVISLEIEVLWVYLRMMYDFKGITEGEFKMLSETRKWKVIYENSNTRGKNKEL